MNQPAWATFYGTPKTGLLNIEEGKTNYSLFVPTDYTSEHAWPLIVALHDEGGRGDDYIKAWTQEAEKRGAIVLAPTFDRIQSTPTPLNDRILRLIQEISAQYEIDPARILVTGFGAGGHYAYYLGLRYPKQFRAVASVGEANEGPLKNLFSFEAGKNKVPLLELEQQGEATNPAPAPAILDWFDGIVTNKQTHNKG